MPPRISEHLGKVIASLTATLVLGVCGIILQIHGLTINLEHMADDISEIKNKNYVTAQQFTQLETKVTHNSASIVDIGTEQKIRGSILKRLENRQQNKPANDIIGDL